MNEKRKKEMKNLISNELLARAVVFVCVANAVDFRVSRMSRVVVVDVLEIPYVLFVVSLCSCARQWVWRCRST